MAADTVEAGDFSFMLVNHLINFFFKTCLLDYVTNNRILLYSISITRKTSNCQTNLHLLLLSIANDTLSQAIHRFVLHLRGFKLFYVQHTLKLGKRMFRPLLISSNNVMKQGALRYLRRLHENAIPNSKRKENDGEFQDLNEMYSDMFTPNQGTQHQNDGPSVKSEIDELNAELSSMNNFNFEKLSCEKLQQITLKDGKFILRSLSINPYYNLALEDYIFRNTPIDIKDEEKFQSQRLLFYINDKCAVIGKNQTIWKELYLGNLIKKGFEVLRRLSGGGAVVHDLGNVNYSFLTSRDKFKTSFFNELLVKSMSQIDRCSSVTLNKRGDITYMGKKCSGSAFKIARGKAYHHGTMLVSANLSSFHGLLKPDHVNGIEWKCNSVDSVRSEITNIPLSSPQEFIDLCIEGFQREFSSEDQEEIPIYYCDEESATNSQIKETMKTLEDDHWKYFSGPKFTLTLESNQHYVSVEKGLVVQSNNPLLIGKSFKEVAETEPFKTKL